MIQRIQSLWLLLSSASFLLLSRLPIATGIKPEGSTLKLMVAERLHLMLLSIALLVLPLITIFLFKNRVGQKKLIWVHTLLSILMVVFFWLAKDTFTDVEPPFISSAYGIGVVVPVIAIVFNVLAYRGIRADEKLIKSADKFR
jgi:hypothetical protein